MQFLKYDRKVFRGTPSNTSGSLMVEHSSMALSTIFALIMKLSWSLAASMRLCASSTIIRSLPVSSPRSMLAMRFDRMSLERMCT